jgi:hypothetical protein
MKKISLTKKIKQGCLTIDQESYFSLIGRIIEKQRRRLLWAYLKIC